MANCLKRSKPASAEGKELPPATRLKSQRESRVGSNSSLAEEPLKLSNEPPAPVPPIEARKPLPPPVELKGSILKKRSVTSVSEDQTNEANGQKEISKQRVYSSHRFKSYES